MQVGEFVLIIMLNCIIIFVLYFLQKRSLEKRIKHLKKEVQELEDLVAAIIEEFEEITEMNEEQHRQDENPDSIVTPEIEHEDTLVEIEPIHEPLFSENAAATSEAENIQQYSMNNVESPSDNQIQITPSQSLPHHRPVNDPRHQQIISLWEQGVSIADIAKELGIGRGEIQLVLGIYRRG